LSTKEFEVPKKFGACADLLFKTREVRLEMQKKVDELEKRESAIKNYIINTLPKSEASGVAGKYARVGINVKTVPVFEDSDLFWRKFNPKRDFDLVQKRLSREAVEARWEAGKEVPGVGKFDVVTVSINKL